MTRKGSLVAALAIFMAICSMAVQATPWQSTGQSTSSLKTGGGVTPQQKYCPPGDPTCLPGPPPNQPPTISWSVRPVSGQYFLPTDSIPLGVYAGDPDGSVAKVEFVLDSSVQSTDTSSPYATTLTLTGVAAGSHTVYAIAFDNLGRTTSTESVTFYVRNSVVKGNVDGVSNSGAISGWACSTYLPQSIHVDLYLGGPYGTGTYIGRYLANKSSEAAVASACDVNSGSYRYQITLSEARRQTYSGQKIYVYGISPIGAANHLLTHSGDSMVPPPDPPTISWAVYPAGGQESMLSTDTLNLAVHASDAYGSVAKVNFILDGKVHSTDVSSPYHAYLSDLTAGSHTAYAVAYNNVGARASTSAVTIHVHDSVVKGYVDGVTSDGVITGWACSTYLDQSIDVDLYLGGPYGTGTKIGRYSANKSSGSSIDSACDVDSGSYKFSIPLSDALRIQHGDKKIYVYGISPVGTSNNLLSNSGNYTVPDFVRDAQFISQDVNSSMQTGATQNVIVKMRNNGDYTWTAGTNFRLGSQNPGNNSTWGTGRAYLSSDVAPGQTATFQFTIQAPSTPGTYNFQWRMLQEGVVWFGDTTPNVGIHVLSGSISASPNPCDIAAGGTTCTTSITWSSNSSTAQVWVTGLNGGTPQLFTQAQSGVQSASWITTSGDRFELKSDGYVLASVDVKANPPPVVTESSSMDYDELGRVIAVRDSAGTIKASYEYDADDNVTKVTDALGHVTTMTYDALGRVQSVMDAAGYTTHYQYDKGDRITEVIDPRGNATTYTRDGFGQLWEQTNPDTGTTTYSYDAYGLLLGMTRANGVLTMYQYDALDRPVTVTAGAQAQQMSYDSCANGIGRLCSASDANSTTSYTYTPEGLVSERQFTVDGTTYALDYAYDDSGRISTITYPDGNKVDYSYQDGLPSQVTANIDGTSHTVATALTYRGGDRLLTSWAAGNGLTNTYSYDEDGRLTGIQVPGVQDLTFTYDDANRITKITNGMNATLTQSFGYDAMSQLTSVTATAIDQNFQYDANGNRSQETQGGVTTVLDNAVQSNHLTGYTTGSTYQATMGYDDDGNVTSQTDTNGSSVSLTYDAFNRMSQAQVNGAVTTYAVGPEGQRLRKSGQLGTTYFAPDSSGNLLAEDPTSGWVDYVWLGGRLIGRLANGQIDAVHTDQVNRPEAVTNAQQAVVWQAQNYAFNRTVSTSSITMNLGFPGQFYDVETGFWNNGFRNYDASLGRYVESDPIGLEAGFNTYTYAHNNPIEYIDPYGLDVTITIGNRTYSSTRNSVEGTIQVTSDRTKATFFGYTLENAHAGDAGNKGPIPAGTYSAFVRKDHTPNRIELKNVPGYQNIQIHNGNYPRNFKGCFGAGTSQKLDFIGNTVYAINQINSIIKSDATGNITVVVGPVH